MNIDAGAILIARNWFAVSSTDVGEAFDGDASA
jgi:hypothetical protein